jgi:hypothetical protein
MALDERSGFTTGTVFSAPAHRFSSHLEPFFNRPLLIGAATVLASLLFCGTLVQNDASSEGNSQQVTPSAEVSRQHHSARSEEVPLLFLAILGLAGLALSQTRPEPKDGERAGPFRAGKKVNRRQELPAIKPPQPHLVLPSGVIAREHHDHIIGLEPVGGSGMLNE